ncbi:hypothetical protein [Arthrobacter roseus]|uniref:hypothetical protein n=1 Tax=Arthrobacter roseus TaxID=136274 RepID=UPI0019658B8C|nr:hypothetical protein [Arthrobacter roseus]MBM7849369.1 hypothetical protein [Arthrobacter roseus]
MSETWGANPDQLRTLAKQCGTGSQTLTDISKSLSTVVNNPNMWKGGDADRLRGSWNSGMKARLLSASKLLDKASTDLVKQAKEQEQASQVGGSSGRGRNSGGSGGSGGEGGSGDNDFWGPDWLADEDSPFRNGWDIYGYAKYLPTMRAGLFDMAGMAHGAGSLAEFMDPKAWAMFQKSNMFSQFANTSSNLFDGNWHRALNLTEGSSAFKAFNGLGKGLGGLAVGLDTLDAFNHFQDGETGEGIYSGSKAVLGALSFAPPPVGTAAMIASGGLFLYDNVPVIHDAVNATGEAIADGAEAVGGAISDGAEAVGDFFGF